MVHERPTLLVDLLRLHGIPVRAFNRIELMPADVPNLVPTQFRADSVVGYCQDDEVTWAVVFEVQLSSVRRKRRVWPAYVANVYERTGCPVILIVVSPIRRVAKWCAEPILVGDPGLC
jgi:hypothetical protein